MIKKKNKSKISKLGQFVMDIIDFKIDTTFNMLVDTPPKKDPDTFSQTLNNYHKVLWEKPLSDGTLFTLTQNEKPPYNLTHQSKHGYFKLSSDSIAHTLSTWKETQSYMHLVDVNQFKEFYHLAFTIGGYIIFPSEKIENKPTLNIIRGMHPLIRDRFDLTLECIRLWYLNLESPLYNHIQRYFL